MYLSKLDVLARGTPCSHPLLVPLTRKSLPTEGGLAPPPYFPALQWPAPIAQNCLAAVGPAAAACLLLLGLAANWRIRPTERGALQVPSFALLLSHHIPNSVPGHQRLGHPHLHSRRSGLPSRRSVLHSYSYPSLLPPRSAFCEDRRKLSRPIPCSSLSSQGQPSSAWVALTGTERASTASLSSLVSPSSLCSLGAVDLSQVTLRHALFAQAPQSLQFAVAITSVEPSGFIFFLLGLKQRNTPGACFPRSGRSSLQPAAVSFDERDRHPTCRPLSRPSSRHQRSPTV